ncbi:MAG: T9SS type A sorting domain-containing protein [Ignavibacteriae bacterium]|nr:T9SS type A sorting domain-containing protein [Ignavibacteriota bacterium]
MKKLIYIFTFVLFVHITFKIDNCNAQWVQMPNGLGTYPTTIYSLTTLGSNIFAGRHNFPTGAAGVYISTNNGANWSQTSLANKVILSLLTVGTNIFAGTDGDGVYISTNNGTNWIQTTLNNENVHSLAVSGNTIFAGCYGVFYSTNNGNSWTQTTLDNHSISSLATLGNNIFAGTDDNNGVFLSTDNGVNWNVTALNNKLIRSLAINGSTIFAGAQYPDGVYRSTNNGMNWTQSGLTNQTVNSFVVSGTNIFAGTTPYSYESGGVYLSTNNGVSWINKNQGFVGYLPEINALLVANNYIFAGTGSYSVYRRSYSEITGIQNISTETPSKYSLSQNYPNPFNPTTNIKFSIVNTGDVKLVVYDIQGREVQTLVNESLKPGTYEAAFDASSLNSGVYFYKLETNGFTETKKMLMIK